MRNPQGGEEWTGTWSDSDGIWTDELKEKLGWSEANDGTFFIGWEDYRKQFDSTTACFIIYPRPEPQRIDFRWVETKISGPITFKFTLGEDLDVENDFFSISAEGLGPEGILKDLRKIDGPHVKSEVKFEVFNSNDESLAASGDSHFTHSRI